MTLAPDQLTYHHRREAYALLGEPDGPLPIDALVELHQREEPRWECEIPVSRRARPHRAPSRPTLRGSLLALRLMVRVWGDMKHHQRSRVVENAALALEDARISGQRPEKPNEPRVIPCGATSYLVRTNPEKTGNWRAR